MSESSDSGPGRREVAHRLFAAEFDDAEFSYSESDEERAPNYVVTPTGARVNRLFVVGVLTELEQVNDEVLRARIVDPTGPFVVYAGQYQPEALAFLEAATPPLFVAVTGKARTFEPEDSDRVFTSIRPESISEVDAETRDRWVVQAAEQTLERVDRLASAKQSGLSGDALQRALVAADVSESDAAGAALALEYYDTTGDYLAGLRELALNATRVVAGERDEAGSLSRSPGDGTDAPLASLATMALEAPTESSSAESSEEATVPDDSVTAEPETAGSATAETGTDEPVGEPESAASVTGDETAESVTAETEATESATEPESSSASESAAEPDETVDSSVSGEVPTTETEPEPAESTTESAGTTEPTTDADSGASVGAPDEGTSDTLGDFDSAGGADATGADATDSDTSTDTPAASDTQDATDDEVGDFDTEFELDEDEREEIEAEYGTDFQSGTEVDDAGEADIETPDPEELAEAEAAAVDEPTDAGSGMSTGDETESADVGGTESPDAAAEDVDLEDAVMATMTDLNDGSGADREAVIVAVVDAHGADRAAVEDAIQDALMGGRCYEPDDGKLTPI